MVGSGGEKGAPSVDLGIELNGTGSSGKPKKRPFCGLKIKCHSTAKTMRIGQSKGDGTGARFFRLCPPSQPPPDSIRIFRIRRSSYLSAEDPRWNLWPALVNTFGPSPGKKIEESLGKARRNLDLPTATTLRSGKPAVRHCSTNLNRVGLEIDVSPLETQSLAAPAPSRVDNGAWVPPS